MLLICSGIDCGKSFSGSARSKFCSDKCRARAHRRDKFQTKLRNLKLPLTKPCDVCGQHFVRETMGQRKHSPNRLATPQRCKDLQAEAPAAQLAERGEFLNADNVRCYSFTCADPKCGKVVSRPVHRGKRQRYCTSDCWQRVYKSRTAAVVKESSK